MKTSSDLRPLLDMIKKNGYKIVPSGKHHKVLDPKGRVVTDDNGPLIISSTPGDHRARDMHMKRLRDAGVIKKEQDPWKPDKGEGAEQRKQKGPGMSEEQKQAIRDATARKSRENAERTRKIRARIEPIVAKIGGWDKKGTQSNLGLIYYHLMETLNRVGRPPTEGAAKQVFNRLKAGQTLGEQTVELVEIFLDDLERDGDPLARYFQLQREAKGIVQRTPGVPAPFPRQQDLHGGEPDPAEPEPETPRLVELPRRHPAEANIPKLSIRAAMLMSLAPDANLDEIQTLAEKLAMVEMQAIE